MKQFLSWFWLTIVVEEITKRLIFIVRKVLVTSNLIINFDIWIEP